MTNVLLSTFLILLAGAVQAQGRTKTMTRDIGTVVLHFFTTGQVSMKEWMDTDDRWGRSGAWVQDGRELINFQTRKIGGHASVALNYHKNGAISKAEVSDAPDGGIQWYRSTTTFDENGQRTGFAEQGRGSDGPIRGVDVRVQPAPEVPEPHKEKPLTEHHLFVSEVFVVNPTKWTCKIHVVAEHPSPALTKSEYTIGPGDTLRIGAYSTIKAVAEPECCVSITVYRKRHNSDNNKMSNFRTEQVQVHRQHRRYYKVMHGWVPTKKIR